MNLPPPAERELLDLLSEELAEAIQAIGKIQRHGFDSHDPTSRKQYPPDNREMLTQELGDVLAVTDMAVKLGVLKRRGLDGARFDKLVNVQRWLHSQTLIEAARQCVEDGK